VYIYGSECTLTLIRDNLATAIPYSLETIREEREEVPLDPLVGYILPITTIPVGIEVTKVLGCTVTRICNTSREPLAALLIIGHNLRFTFHLNRIVEQRIYTNLHLTGWELRADRDEPVYLRLDIEGREATDWDFTTKNLPWEQNETLHFYDGDVTLDGQPSNNIYRFSLTRIYGDAISTILQLHYPLKVDDAFNNAREFNEITITLGGRLRFTLTRAVLLSFEAKTDNADEILVFRRFRIDGDCTIEVCNHKGEWVAPV
jgi:hypothetical protein